MSFDIYALDEIAEELMDAGDMRELAEYSDALLEIFAESPEAQALPDDVAGFWPAVVIDYGFRYIGVTLPQMEPYDLEELLVDVFPHKISLNSREEAEDIILELTAFWRFLQREFEPENAGPILAYLEEVDQDEVVDVLFDSANFGPAKSFVMAGKEAGFDMTDPDEINMFMQIYNQVQMIGAGRGLPDAFDDFDDGVSVEPTKKKQNKAKKKKKRKAARAARKRNRRK